MRDVDENNLSHHFLEEALVYPELAGESGSWGRVPALPQSRKSPWGRHFTSVGSSLQRDPPSLPSPKLLQFINIRVKRPPVLPTPSRET